MLKLNFLSSIIVIKFCIIHIVHMLNTLNKITIFYEKVLIRIYIIEKKIQLHIHLTSMGVHSISDNWNTMSCKIYRRTYVYRW